MSQYIKLMMKKLTKIIYIDIRIIASIIIIAILKAVNHTAFFSKMTKRKKKIKIKEKILLKKTNLKTN